MNINNIVQKCKITFRIPLPLRNYFYKGKRISFKTNWFCKSCEKSFDLKPWNKYKNSPMNSFVCPHCSSKSIYHSGELVKAQIDKAQTSELLNIIDKQELFNKSILLTAK